MEGIANFACRPFSRGAEKHIKTNKHRPHKGDEKRTPPTPRKSSKKQHFQSQNGSQNRSRGLLERPSAPSAQQLGPKTRPRALLKASGGRKKNFGRARGRPKKISEAFFAPLKTDNHPEGGGRPELRPLVLEHFSCKTLLAPRRGANIEGPGFLGGHSWGWGETLKLLQQQASLLFKASLREA